jgi:ATP-binding cassette subfamily C protein LapB
MLERLPEAIKQRLSLARCFVKTACLYLLDRPEINLDDAGAAALVGKIESLKTKATVIFTTHRPSHMLLANRLVVLDAGQIVMDGPTKQVLEKLNAR